MFLLTDQIDGYQMTIVDTIWPIIFVVVISTLFYHFRNQIRISQHRKWIPILLLGLMIIFESGMILNLIMAPFQSWSITVKHLPLHLCSTSAVLVMLYLIFRKEFLLEMLIIQGMVGAIVTFIFPSSTSYPFSYDYLRFFLSHAILFITPIYFIIIEEKKLTKRTLKIAFISVHIIAIVAVSFNLLFDTDYMYILPDNTRNLFHFLPLLDAMPWLGVWPMVILLGEALVIPVYYLSYRGLLLFQKNI